MKLSKFSKLIEAMPEQEHACDSKRNTWNKFINKNDRVSGILQSIFDNEADDKGVIRISRHDLYLDGKKTDLAQFIMKTFGSVVNRRPAKCAPF